MSARHTERGLTATEARGWTPSASSASKSSPVWDRRPRRSFSFSWSIGESKGSQCAASKIRGSERLSPAGGGEPRGTRGLGVDSCISSSTDEPNGAWLAASKSSPVWDRRPRRSFPASSVPRWRVWPCAPSTRGWTPSAFSASKSSPVWDRRPRRSFSASFVPRWRGWSGASRTGGGLFPCANQTTATPNTGFTPFLQSMAVPAMMPRGPHAPDTRGIMSHGGDAAATYCMGVEMNS